MEVRIGVHLMFGIQGGLYGRIINVLLLFHASATDPKNPVTSQVARALLEFVIINRFIAGH